MSQNYWSSTIISPQQKNWYDKFKRVDQTGIIIEYLIIIIKYIEICL